MIITRNIQGEQTAVLENATRIGYEKKTNSLWSAHFTLPLKDKKNDKVKALQFVEIHDDIKNKYIGLFQIVPKLTKINKTTQTVTYECRHVLATLIGATLFKYHQLTNYTTKAVLEYLINQQHTKHWKLGKVDFTRYFHYSWENETLLSALFSVPQAFDENYRWSWDTQSYPFTLNLEKVPTEPTVKVEEGYNLTGIEIEENPNALWNRIYPLGSGEGVNQLDITSVNNGVPYVEDTASIAKYGLYERTWPDKRFVHAENLKATAERMLELWAEPIVNWSIEASDLSFKTGLKLDELEEGKVIRLMLDDYDDVDLRIVSEKKSDIYLHPEDIVLQLNNLNEDITDDIAGIQRKQQINELYSQGATNILNFSYQDNSDENVPAVIPFEIDNDVVNVNTIELTYRTKPFRAYSGVTESGGSTTQTSTSGGGTTRSTTSGGSTTQTTTSGGSVSKSTASGGSSTRTSSSSGESTRTSSANGTHRHAMFTGTGVTANTSPGTSHILSAYNGFQILVNEGTGLSTTYYTEGAADNHTHTVTTPAHTHSVDIPAHTHNFEIPNHSHSVGIPNHNHEVTIPDHSHDLTIPAHTHDIKHEIVEASERASSVLIEVDGNPVPHTATSGNRINLADYMSKGTDGTITRGRHEITITPDKIARIEADVILRVFIRSQLGSQM